MALIRREKDWLVALASGTIATSNELKGKCLEWFFLVKRFMDKCAEITNFKQGDDKSLYGVWEHFKLLLKRCPDHSIDELNQMQILTQGLKG